MARAASSMPEPPILCLPPATGDLPKEGGLIISSPATPYRKEIEHAGHVYQQTLIRSYGLGQHNCDEEKQPSSESEKQTKPSNSPPIDSSDAAKKLASKMALGSDDLYELLELGDKRWHATADDIKKSFRRISLIYHPDKISHQGEEAKQNSETHFKAVMKAYDILSDKKKRAAYDSIDDVDDSIPSEKDATNSPERFYEKFGACFALNARWSVSNRVPELGNDETDIEAVDRFYDFWYSFKSWRDFSFDLEYDTDQAESREEKRWMDRQNAKHVKAKKLEENTRIRTLVDLSYKHDPRLVRVRKALKAEKDAVKEERRRKTEEAARAAKEKEEQEKIEAEKRAAEEKVKRAAAKKQKDAARQILRKARQRLRAAARDLDLMSTDRGLVAIETMCAKGTVESIEAVLRVLAKFAIREPHAKRRAIFFVENALKNPSVPFSNEADALDAPFDAYSTRSAPKEQEEVAIKARGQKAEESETQTPLTNGHSVEKAQSTCHWTLEELSLLSKGAAKFPGGTRDRWNRLAEYIGTKTADEILRKVSESRPSKISHKSGMSATRAASDVNAFERFQEKKKGKPVVPQRNTGSSISQGSVSQPPNKLHFTPKQQTMFEAALKKHPVNEGEESWSKVSAAVGRTPAQCKERYMELIAYYKSRNAAK